MPPPVQDDSQALPRALKALACLLARQAARDLVSKTAELTLFKPAPGYEANADEA